MMRPGPIPGGIADLDACWEARPMTGREQRRYLPIFRQGSGRIDSAVQPVLK